MEASHVGLVMLETGSGTMHKVRDSDLHVDL